MQIPGAIAQHRRRAAYACRPNRLADRRAIGPAKRAGQTRRIDIDGPCDVAQSDRFGEIRVDEAARARDEPGERRCSVDGCDRSDEAQHSRAQRHGPGSIVRTQLPRAPKNRCVIRRQRHATSGGRQPNPRLQKIDPDERATCGAQTDFVREIRRMDDDDSALENA